MKHDLPPYGYDDRVSAKSSRNRWREDGLDEKGCWYSVGTLYCYRQMIRAADAMSYYEEKEHEALKHQ